MRKFVLGLVGSLLAAVAVGTQPPETDVAVASRATPRPNVVLIVVDDMRQDELKYMPRTRRLLRGHGVEFVNSFAPYPLCCPARASILTGQYAHNHRVLDVHEPYAFPSLRDESTLATWLQDAGYATVMLGKYLNGYGYLPEPGKETGKSLRYVPPGWTEWRASIDRGLARDHPDHGGTYRYFDTTLSDDGHGFDNYEGKYQTYVYARLSRQIIRERSAASRPFFFFVNYTAPHKGTPVERDDVTRVVDDNGNVTHVQSPARPRKLWDRFDDVITEAPGADWIDPDPSDKPRYLRKLPPMNRQERAAIAELARQRAQSLYAVDRAVKQTVGALRRSGELDDTLLIFTSDNGAFLGEQNIRHGKILPYEESLRTPLLMRGPGIPAGERRTDPFIQIDFGPTIADLAGAEPDIPVDGVSMLDVAREGDRGWGRAVLTETGPQRVVRDTDEAGQPLSPTDPGERDVRWAIGIRTSRYLYVDLASGEEELYDLATDPDQYHNLVEDPQHAQVLARLRQELARMRACDAQQCQAPMAQPLTTAAP